MNLDLSRITMQPVNVYYLRMESRPIGGMPENSDVTFEQIHQPISCKDYLKYYTAVGMKTNWVDRIIMPEEELLQKINANDVIIYVMKVKEKEAGYVELVVGNPFVEILYFGLFPEFIGKGLGKFFLGWSIYRAWSFNPQWIQLNTCGLDHENALLTYKKSGFVQYKATIEQRRVFN